MKKATCRFCFRWQEQTGGIDFVLLLLLLLQSDAMKWDEKVQMLVFGMPIGRGEV